DGTGDLWRIAQAIIWAADPAGDPNTHDGADVSNISFGYPEGQQLLKSLLDDCGDGITTDGTTFPEIGENQLVIIAGSGNGGNSSPIYPAAELEIRAGRDPKPFDGVLSVGAVTRFNQTADFSTVVPFSTLALAPGEDIVCAIPGGRYGVWSGTSMSAPIASAIAALVKARYPAALPKDIADQLEETGIPTPPFGVDRIDALSALTTPIQNRPQANR
ncbi:MAG TPA: S8 family serine peptidase, partial [Pyrinomonadaceae bacterium]|nr:S8 family serine peptidase [Pyrinomonadaceae bacterium]